MKRLARPTSRDLMTLMKESDRTRLPVMLGLVLFAVLCFLVPRFMFAVRLGLMEMRYFSFFIIMGILFIWALIKVGRKKR
ncbi:MAG TPA: hypothetical protein VKC60_13100 [Opitutaceae bacterium]|nr:hypothetical protein [Opitutaceae bacterium]